MDIDNDTNQPVDYDVIIGPISAESASGSFAVVAQPRFRIPAGGSMVYELSTSGSLNHYFLIVDDGAQAKTVIELKDAPSDKNVKLRSTVTEGKTYYSAQLVKE